MAKAAGSWPEEGVGEIHQLFSSSDLSFPNITYYDMNQVMTCDTAKSRFEHLDPETEVGFTTEPTTEEEKEQRQIAEDKREERKKILKEKKKQRKKAEAEKSRKMFEAKEATKAEKRAADEKRRAESKRIADERREQKRMADEKMRAEEKQRADAACSRLVELPGELQVLNNLISLTHHLMPCR